MTQAHSVFPDLVLKKLGPSWLTRGGAELMGKLQGTEAQSSVFSTLFVLVSLLIAFCQMEGQRRESEWARGMWDELGT